MGITPCFDPTTGASGGASGGGGSAGFVWRQITDLNALTFSDPNSLVTSYSVASGVHSVTLATVSVSNANINFAAGPNFTGARWTFPLVYPDGSAVLVGDTFQLASKVTDIAFNTARTWNIGVAAVQNPSSTVLTTMDALGTTFGHSASLPLVGTWRRTSVSTGSLTNGVQAFGQSLFGGLPNKYKAGAVAIIQSATATVVATGIDSNTWTASAATQVYGIIAVGSLGTATTTGGTVDFRLYYNAEKLS